MNTINTTMNSSNSNSYMSSAPTSSNQNSIPSNLSEYLSKAKTDSRKLISAINSLCNETDKDGISDAAEKFIKYYNNFIKDNKIYNDKGLNQLTQKINSIVNDNSQTLSRLGINIKANGKLNLDQSTLDTAISKNLYSKIIDNTQASDGVFFKLNNFLSKIKKDSSYYLSYITKQLIINGNKTITTSNNASTTTNGSSAQNAAIGSDNSSNTLVDTYV